MTNDVQLLKKGDYATFRDKYGDIVKRKVQLTWKHLNGDYRYNTGSGCNGEQFMNEDIITIGKKG